MSIWRTEQLQDNSSSVGLVTLRDFIRWGGTRFAEAQLHFGHGSDNPLDEAAALVLYLLHIPHERSEAYLDAVLTEVERRAVEEVFQLRIEKRLPAAYITHEAWFAGLSFYVNEDVLVPRSPIAELIEAGFAPWIDPKRVNRVLDLCTGSGCIAIATAYAFPEAEVDATDISNQALEVAKENRSRHDLSDRLNLIHSDIYERLQGKRYDVIVTNPPYVDDLEMQILPKEYRHEPRIGLE
ncbi:MAG: 50S ribosomal protein L3 N(5)-glutamine methyltransferase, partial [Gammaproteobacteria bacterium]|nr:50S ribosomal protein L3 N(5)-glutamine methyltransferase [Gammaproteobacteria bacterium]